MVRKSFQILFIAVSLCFPILSASGQPANKPDLIAKEVFFDTDNVLRVILKNEGEAEVPLNQGKLLIFVDGRLGGEYPFTSFGDQSFRLVGGSSTLRTNLRIGGKNRRIAVSIDPENQVDESNEIQNTLSRTFTPPVITGPDFIISDLELEPQPALIEEAKYRFKIKIGNIGSRNSRASQRVRLTVTVNNSMAANITRALPVLNAGGSSTTIILEPTRRVLWPRGVRKTKVSVELSTSHLFDEVDNTNNIREEILPGGPSLAPYTALLALPKIKYNIFWEESNGSTCYPDWTENQKADLNKAILALEKGEPQTLREPPALLDNLYISADDAWKIYLAHVAQSLWVEVHGVVSWHLFDFSDAQIVSLLDSYYLLRYESATNKYFFDTVWLGNSTAWNPRICYEFLSNLRLIKSSQLETISALTDWMRGRLRHIAEGVDFNDQFGYPGPPPADKVLYPLKGKLHMTAGCWGTSGLYRAILRGVNVPVLHQIVNLGDTDHSRPEFWSVDRSMPHGDDPYNAILTPSGAVIPSSNLLYTSAEMISRILSPAVDCVGSECNTVGEQASYNHQKAHWQLAYQYMSDYILVEYSAHGAQYLNDSLRGPRVGPTSSVQQHAKPYFTDTERAAMVTAVENKVREIGGGNLNAGRSKVMARYNRFQENK